MADFKKPTESKITAPDELFSLEKRSEKNEKSEGKVLEQSDAAARVEGVIEEGLESIGEVSEQTSEGKKVAPSGQNAGSKTQATAVKAIKPIHIPKIEVMRTQVSKAIKHEIHALEKEAQRIAKSPTSFNAFTLNSLVAKIRELKEILAMVTYATFETLKGWWLKFVKGN